MDAQFWHDKWQRREIGFHREQINPYLPAYFPTLGLHAGQTVFLPLCGKTRDVSYFLQLGLQVVGVELSEVAVQELFADLGVQPEISDVLGMRCYQTTQLRIFVGDFFKLTAEHLGRIDAIYDRAALVALPLNMRQAYAKHLLDLSHNAPQLLITYEYDQNVVDGPPFSISRSEVQQHYGGVYAIEDLHTAEVEGGMKGKTSATESVYCLRSNE
ncbi:thiopurine S-methyltransferase [Undibacterium baiyunense]|uniref:Thiopurine S-methyltransferase n=1 Tax=Undibacterium baiyunense TaxID=2828731 RepID=A0A941DC21_9BURK|nr:thiopurine S-methyltransferase [Undibacterium baiyunense]MBR7745929.1 thiopurine S-methyltransferase [Undibacterium baiyunense]